MDGNYTFVFCFSRGSVSTERKDGNTRLVSRALEQTSLKEEGTYTWFVKDFTKLDECRVCSPEFQIGGYFWRLLLFPRGHSTQDTIKYISLYLDYQEAIYTPSSMWPTAKFKLIVVKQADTADSIIREANIGFTSQERSWGFTEFLSVQELQNPESVYLVDDVLKLRVDISLQRDENLGAVSKLETGFLGIKSPDGTALLSSFLQCLYHIKVFRKAVFQMPGGESDDPKKSLPLMLQHFFCKLKYQNTSVETKDLIEVLNWNCTNMHLRHNVLEMQRTLFERLCEVHQTDGIKDCISGIFMGEYSSYNESPTIPEASVHKHSFMEIPINVLECRDIYASLERFCKIDGIEKGNHYQMTRRSGLDELKQYVLFDSFPTVLQFNLKRCHYNPDRKAILKINSYYEFYDELDLDYNDRVLLSNNADRTIENKYRLHSVIVQADGAGGGHYCVYIRRKIRWCKFDGEVVKKVSREEAITAQFGDQDGTPSANFSKGFKSVNKSAAVMLVYIRQSEWERVMCNAKRGEIPRQVRKLFDQEQMEVEKQRMKEEARFYVNIKLATEFHFAEHIGETIRSDLVDFNSIKNYRILKETPFEDFKELVSKDLGIPEHLQRFWVWISGINTASRILNPLGTGMIDVKTVSDLWAFRIRNPAPDEKEYSLMTIALFLESPEGTSIHEGIFGNTLHPIQRNEFLIFLKYYDPASMKLVYLGHLFVEWTCKFRIVFKKAKKMAGLTPGDKVIGFQEVRYLTSLPYAVLSPRATPKSRHIAQGNIIVIQKQPSLREFARTVVKGIPKLCKVHKLMGLEHSEQ